MIPASVIKAFQDAEQEALVPAELKAKGWIYRDMPGKCTPEAWGMLLEIMGEGEYQLLIMSEGPGWVRGQFLLSPQAIEHLKDNERVLRVKNAIPPTRS